MIIWNNVIAKCPSAMLILRMLQLLLRNILIQVGTNGYFSFGQGLTIAQPLLYPNGPAFTVAPFWADNDIREEGEISYEVHSSGSPLISEVNSFIRSRQGVEFAGTWMVIAEWFQVHEYPYSVLFPEDPVSYVADMAYQVCNRTWVVW